MIVTKRITTGLLALAMTATFGAVGATSASAAPHSSAVAAAQPAATTLPVTGTLLNGTAFTGQLSNLTTSVVNGVLTLSGTITGTGLPAAGVPFSTPITNLAASCQVLTLDLGPLHLDLLGLVIDLAPVHLNITAQSGPGNLLGNLVCAVAHLLDNSGNPLGGISALLNRLLAGLGLA